MSAVRTAPDNARDPLEAIRALDALARRCRDDAADDTEDRL